MVHAPTIPCNGNICLADEQIAGFLIVTRITAWLPILAYGHIDEIR